MNRSIIFTIVTALNFTILFAQESKLQIGIQSGFSIPTGLFASGYEAYSSNGYAKIGVNYKVYAEYKVKGVFYIGVNYINFSNSLEEGNLNAAFNNSFSSNNATVSENSNTKGVLGSIILKGTETPLYIKGFLGLGFSKTASVNATNTLENVSVLQSSSDLGQISGFGIGLYVPIRNKWFIELEGDYISSNARPGIITIKDNIKNLTYLGESISYNQTVFNINVGIGLFLFND